MAARLTQYGKSEQVAEEIEFLLSQHQGVAYILATIGAKPATLARRMARAGRHDLARVIHNQSTIPYFHPEEDMHR